MIVRVQLILAVAGMSTLITYAWWLHQRVWRLRGDLFSIRDELWITMAERGELDDPSHRAFREGVNAVIRVAPMLSIFTMLRLVLDIGAGEIDAPPRTINLLDRSGIAAPVFEARRAICLRVARYLLLETVSGLMLTAILAAFLMSRDFRDATANRVGDLFDRHVFEQYNEDMSPVRPIEAMSS